MTDTIDSLRAERDELRVRLREVADCLADVASGKGGWAWENVLFEIYAALEEHSE